MFRAVHYPHRGREVKWAWPSILTVVQQAQRITKVLSWGICQLSRCTIQLKCSINPAQIHGCHSTIPSWDVWVRLVHDDVMYQKGTDSCFVHLASKLATSLLLPEIIMEWISLFAFLGDAWLAAEWIKKQYQLISRHFPVFHVIHHNELCVSCSFKKCSLQLQIAITTVLCS